MRLLSTLSHIFKAIEDKIHMLLCNILFVILEGLSNGTKKINIFKNGFFDQYNLKH